MMASKKVNAVFLQKLPITLKWLAVSVNIAVENPRGLFHHADHVDVLCHATTVAGIVNQLSMRRYCARIHIARIRLTILSK